MTEITCEQMMAKCGEISQKKLLFAYVGSQLILNKIKKKMKIKDLRFQRVADMTRPLPNKQRLRLEVFTFSLANSMFVVREALTGRTLVYF